MASASSPSPLKPGRRKKTPEPAQTPSSRKPPAKSNQRPKAQKPPFPLVAFFWPARGRTSQWVILPLLLMIVGLYRWTVGFWGYSGFQSPPMHGDFEAQRHWMEITNHIPMTQWYFHDLDWWGLDYPPLTAYHSWLLGKLGSIINPQWFAFQSSRGLDDPALKVFMRATVLVSEYLIYVPALVTLYRRLSRLEHLSSWEASSTLAATLMQPATMLIDHAHFQYNTVMLGFVIASADSLISNNFLWSSAYFVAALGFKQMALYYAPTIFAYLLGSCVFPKINIVRFIGIASVTLLSFALLFGPLVASATYEVYSNTQDLTLPEPPLLTSLNLDKTSALYYPLLQLTQSIHRIFPFARGLFEDKVANFWCSLHAFYKLHRFPTVFLQRTSLVATSIAIMPPNLILFLYPQRSLIFPALAATAWGFFLFSFQVHEKSVLVPLLPMTVLLNTEHGLQPPSRAWISWANILGSWTLFPLLKKDQLRVPYFVLTLLWGWLMGVPSLIFEKGVSLSSSPPYSLVDVLTRLLHGGFYFVMIVWHVAEAFYPPPQSKPDLWVVANVIVGASGFGICYLWCLWKMWTLLPARSSGSKTSNASKPKSEGMRSSRAGTPKPKSR